MTNDTTNEPYFPDNLDGYAPWVAKYGLRAQYGKCQCGCGRNTSIAKKSSTRWGHTLGQPVAFVWPHGWSMKPSQPAEERFWEKVDRRGPDDCWEWQGSKLPEGYGAISWDGKNKRAHRVSWEIHNGAIPDGLLVCHSCDNPSCVNPNHLWLGDDAANMRDRDSKKRGNHASGEKHGCAKLSWPQVREIRQEYANGSVTQQKIADKHDVDQTTVSLIVLNRIWKE